ncbi:MAG: Ulp1 family isopeptidase, partial [Terriglobales bacterium]
AGSVKVESVPVTSMPHQNLDTECGLYALYYIRRRLEGVPYTFFEKQRIPDEAMTEFRKHVFRAG